MKCSPTAVLISDNCILFFPSEIVPHFAVKVYLRLYLKTTKLPEQSTGLEFLKSAALATAALATALLAAAVSCQKTGHRVAALSGLMSTKVTDTWALPTHTNKRLLTIVWSCSHSTYSACDAFAASHTHMTNH